MTTMTNEAARPGYTWVTDTRVPGGRRMRINPQSTTCGFPERPTVPGEMRCTKAVFAAAVKLFWLKRGSHDEGRDLL